MAVAVPVGVAVASVVRVVVVVVVSVLSALAIVEVVVAGHVEAVGCAVVCGLVVAEVVLVADGSSLRGRWGGRCGRCSDGRWERST